MVTSTAKRRIYIYCTLVARHLVIRCVHLRIDSTIWPLRCQHTSLRNIPPFTCNMKLSSNKLVSQISFSLWMATTTVLIIEGQWARNFQEQSSDLEALSRYCEHTALPTLCDACLLQGSGMKIGLVTGRNQNVFYVKPWFTTTSPKCCQLYKWFWPSNHKHFHVRRQVFDTFLRVSTRNICFVHAMV